MINPVLGVVTLDYLLTTIPADSLYYLLDLRFMMSDLANVITANF